MREEYWRALNTTNCKSQSSSSLQFNKDVYDPISYKLLISQHQIDERTFQGQRLAWKVKRYCKNWIQRYLDEIIK